MRLCSLIVIEVSGGFLFGVYGCLVRLGFVWMFGWIVDFVVVVGWIMDCGLLIIIILILFFPYPFSSRNYSDGYNN